MNDNEALPVSVNSVIESAKRILKPAPGESLALKWAKKAGVSTPVIRSFMRGEDLKPSTTDRVVKPFGYRAEVVIRERRAS